MIPLQFALRRRMMSGVGAFEFTYTGHFTDKIEGANRVIKFTSSGTLNVSGSVVADVYLLAGGGGAADAYDKSSWDGYHLASGGGGGNQVIANYRISAGEYNLVIGQGGSRCTMSGSRYNDSTGATQGGQTSGFGYTCSGGGYGVAGYNWKAGKGGSPNGGDGYLLADSANVAGGSPNGGGVRLGTSQNGGDGYITLTIPV